MPQRSFHNLLKRLAFPWKMLGTMETGVSASRRTSIKILPSAHRTRIQINSVIISTVIERAPWTLTCVCGGLTIGNVGNL